MFVFYIYIYIYYIYIMVKPYKLVGMPLVGIPLHPHIYASIACKEAVLGAKRAGDQSKASEVCSDCRLVIMMYAFLYQLQFNSISCNLLWTLS